MTPRAEAQFHALGDALEALSPWWRPQPFYEPCPAWGRDRPDLHRALLTLSDTELDALLNDNAALADWLTPWIPGLDALGPLTAVPMLEAAPFQEAGRSHWHIPGRKQHQIAAFADALGQPMAPVLEWCAGKGHLGRHLARRWQCPVISLDYDQTLCHAGHRRAQETGIKQDFVALDAASPEATTLLAGRHAVALHACGDLHRHLILAAVEKQSPALDLSPCCYYKTAHSRYQPYNPDAGLELNRDELHLAVTETMGAGRRERRLRDMAMARKLAYLELHREVTGQPHSPGLKSVPASWLSWPESDWLRQLARREGLALPESLDLNPALARGWRRQAEVMRLSLVRLGFRRPLEIWLALDRALFLERSGYTVRLRQFCHAGVTPRNLLISARRGTGQ